MKPFCPQSISNRKNINTTPLNSQRKKSKCDLIEYVVNNNIKSFMSALDDTL